MAVRNPDKSSSLCSPRLSFSIRTAIDSRGRCQQPVDSTQLHRRPEHSPAQPHPKRWKLPGQRHLSFSHTDSCSSCFLPPWTTSGLHFSFLPRFKLPLLPPADTCKAQPCTSASPKPQRCKKTHPKPENKANRLHASPMLASLVEQACPGLFHT